MARTAFLAEVVGAVTGVLAGFVGLPASAQAQVIQDCQPNQYLDRTATGADRQLNWDFSIATDPERCLQVRVGQTVVWNGNLDSHPLGAQGGDTPNPIASHVNGSVTFNTVGTYGFVCLSHSSMKGAIKVVPASQPAPAVPHGLLAAAGGLLLWSGSKALRRRFQHRTSRGSQARGRTRARQSE